MKPNQLTKDGLTGRSGFNVEGMSLAFHVSANYAATKGMVFVESEEECTNWERMTRVVAEKQGKRIIRCSYCKRPAISLDHSWPYLQEATYCARHRNWQELMRE